MDMWMRLVLVYILHINLEGLVEDKDANKFVQLKGIKNHLWWLQIGCEGVIAQDVTLCAYNTYKFLEFIQTKVIPSLDGQRVILMNKCLISYIS